jgi:hypothetical protein
MTMTPEQIMSTIFSLIGSRGSYGRLYRDLKHASPEDRDDFFEQFSHCTDPLDFIITLEERGFRP